LRVARDDHQGVEVGIWLSGDTVLEADGALRFRGFVVRSLRKARL
jgi:hypothetical protein